MSSADEEMKTSVDGDGEQRIVVDEEIPETTQNQANREARPIELPTKTRLKVTVEKLHVTAEWKWIEGGEDTCGICRMEFEAACTNCKFPRDDCPLVQGVCRHAHAHAAFHAHCIDRWNEAPASASRAQCPLCRQEWQLIRKNEEAQVEFEPEIIDHVSESAIRCFAALIDRFIRKMMDPAELALHSNLVEHLLLTLSQSNDENEPSSSSKAELPSPALVKKVLHQLLPIFCEIFQKSLNSSVRRTSLSLMRKIVENIGDLRQSTSEDDEKPAKTRKMSADASAGAESLVTVVVSVLDQEDDHEEHEKVLLILQSLLEKDAELWVTELIRLGVFERVEAMAKEPPKGLEQVLNATMAELNAIKVKKSTTSAVAMEIDTELGGVGPESLIEDGNAIIAPEADNELAGEAESTSSKPRKSSNSSSASSAILQVVSKISSSVGSSDKSEKKQVKTPLTPGYPYRWNEWRIVRGPTALFIWSDVMLLELPFESNGWFRYLFDNDSHVQFISGMAAVDQQMSQEEKTKQMKDLVTRWKAVKGVFDDDSSSVPVSVLGVPSNSKKLEVPVWELWSTRSSELQIKPTGAASGDGQPSSMTTTIKDDSGGFVFESNNGRKVTIMPETALPVDFHTGWSGHGVSTRKIKFRMEIQKRKVQELAWKLWNDHLKEAHAKPREALVRLEKAAITIENAVRTAKAMYVSKHKNVKQTRIERVQDLVYAMRVVLESIADDRRLSTFEFSVSGIVPALLGVLSLIESHPDCYPAKIFKETFSSGDALSQLASKMVAVLEASENFPKFLYDTPGGSSFGLQLLSRRVRTKLDLPKNDEKENEATGVLLNKSGKVIKCEPLASVRQIKQYLLKLVAKQWHDLERPNYRFVKMIQDSKTKKEPIQFRYTSDFDDQGLIYWLGTNGKSMPDWTNPATISVVKITCSDNRQPFGKPEDVISRDVNPINCHTSDDKNAQFTLDLGVHLIPKSYTLRHARGYGRSALRNWLVQGSKDKQVWELIHAHTEDQSLGDPGSSATWHFTENPEKKSYRYIRIAQNGKNSSGQTYYLSVSGFEIYGDVVDVVLESLGKGKKLMSTTNLVDDRQKKTGPSVASTGQAASAESLQHQTPSLENLLARAMPHAFGIIAENRVQEEDRDDEPMGGEKCDSAASIQSAASSNSQISMSSMNSSVQLQSDMATPRDSAGTPSTPRDEKANPLSVSAPDLAAARQRQQSAETSESQDKNQSALEEDDEEEETIDEEDEDEDGEEAEGDMKDEDRGVFEKLREVMSSEATIGNSSPLLSTQQSVLSTASDSSAPKDPRKKKSIEQKMRDAITLSEEEWNDEESAWRDGASAVGPDSYDPKKPDDESRNVISRRAYGWKVPADQPVYLEGDVRVDLYLHKKIVNQKRKIAIPLFWYAFLLLSSLAYFPNSVNGEINATKFMSDEPYKTTNATIDSSAIFDVKEPSFKKVVINIGSRLHASEDLTSVVRSTSVVLDNVGTIVLNALELAADVIDAFCESRNDTGSCIPKYDLSVNILKQAVPSIFPCKVTECTSQSANISKPRVQCDQCFGFLKKAAEHFSKTTESIENIIKASYCFEKAENCSDGIDAIFSLITPIGSFLKLEDEKSIICTNLMRCI